MEKEKNVGKNVQMDDWKEWLKLQYSESVHGHQGHHAQELREQWLPSQDEVCQVSHGLRESFQGLIPER